MIRNFMRKLAKEGNFKAIPEAYRAQLEAEYKKEEKPKSEPKNVSELARKEEEKK
jgi:hypothetical protein